MKIATFNINNVVKRLENLIDWLAEAEPDVVCLQELKAEQGAFPAEILDETGYEAVLKGQRTWNGVAILARGSKPILTRAALPGDPQDAQAHYRSGGERRAGRLPLPAQRQSPAPVPSSSTSWPGSTG